MKRSILPLLAVMAAGLAYYGARGSLANFVIWRILTEPLHFVMERKMLLGIKQRAEAAAMHLVS